jgi:signal peptidase I
MNENEIVTETIESNEQIAKSPTKEKKKNSFLGEFFEYFELFIFSACAVLILFSFVTRICRVDGPSMLNTLHDSEMLIVSDFMYTPERGDIVVFHQTGDQPGDLNEPIVKRVIATEGEWIDIDRATQTVTIYDENMENPQVLDESTYRYLDSGKWQIALTMSFPVQVPKGHLFVMGDNRNHSADSSTSAVIGFVDTRRVLGRVICRLTPIQKFGPIED